LPVFSYAYILKGGRIQLLRLRNKAILVGFVATLMGCAAQSSYLEADRTRELVRKAVRAAPNDPESMRAQVAFEAGEMSLGEARYGRATDHFNEAKRLAEKVLAKSNVLPASAVSERVQKEIERERILESREQERLKTKDSAPLPEIPIDKRMSLPAEALAKYLSMKESVPMEPDDLIVTPPKEQLPLPPAKMLKQKSPPPARVAQKKEKPGESDKWEDKEEVSSNQVSGAKIVEATGERVAQLPPAPLPSQTDEIETKEAPPRPERKKFELDRKQLQGSINFPPKEVALNDQAMNQLDQLTRFLVENPSNTLILVATRGPGEDGSIVEARFSSIRSYLSARGVPDDQVRLDDENKSGPNPSFEMFYIEH